MASMGGVNTLVNKNGGDSEAVRLINRWQSCRERFWSTSKNSPSRATCSTFFSFFFFFLRT